MKAGITALLLVALLGSCSAGKCAESTLLVFWTSNESCCAAYQSLAAEWNRLYPERQIELKITVYNQERIAGKLAKAFTTGTRFAEGELPDIADIDFVSFQDYIFKQTTNLYPLQNLLSSLPEESEQASGTRLFSHNGICFALPYTPGDLLMCCRSSLVESLAEFPKKACSFKGLAELAAAYRASTGEAMLGADYLGNELFLSLCGQAMISLQTSEEAYQAAIGLMQAFHKNDWSFYLSSGSAYGDSFQWLLQEDKVPCFITTASNLLSIAQEHPEIAAHYTLLSLPSFMGNTLAVRLPATGTAILLFGNNTILARDFLNFTRFSEQAETYPLLYLGDGREDSNALLGEYYNLLGIVCKSINEEGVPLSAESVQQLLSYGYPGDVFQ